MSKQTSVKMCLATNFQLFRLRNDNDIQCPLSNVTVVFHSNGLLFENKCRRRFRTCCKCFLQVILSQTAHFHLPVISPVRRLGQESVEQSVDFGGTADVLGAVLHGALLRPKLEQVDGDGFQVPTQRAKQQSPLLVETVFGELGQDTFRPVRTTTKMC